MATFEEAFQQGFQTQFNKTFKTPNELEAEEKALKLRDLDIQKKEIELSMQKTKHQHELGVQEIAASGFDPSTVARVLSDRFPNEHQYKFDADSFKNSNGTEYRFHVGQYQKNEDGTYKRDPISGERIFTQYEEDGSTIGIKADNPEMAREKFMQEVGRRLNPTAWMASDLEKLMTVIQTNEQIRAGKVLAREKGTIAGDEQRKREGFQAGESEKDRASREKIAKIEADARKFQAGAAAAAKDKGATFPGREGEVTYSEKQMKGLTAKKKSYSESLSTELNEHDVALLDDATSNKTVQSIMLKIAQGDEQAREVLKKEFLANKMTPTVADAFLDQIELLTGEEDAGILSSIGKLFK